MAEKPPATLPYNYHNKEEICSDPNDPQNCIYLVDGKYYYTKVEYDMGGWIFRALIFLVEATLTT